MQLYRIESPHFPGHTIRAVVPWRIVKGTPCSNRCTVKGEMAVTLQHQTSHYVQELAVALGSLL